MKKLISMLLISTLAFTAVSCTDTTTVSTPETEAPSTGVVEEEKPAETPSDTRITLRTASTFGGTDPSAEDYQRIIAEYEGEFPNVVVEDSSQASDEAWKAAITADFAVGNEPDVLFYFSGSNAADFIDQGKVVSVKTIQEEYPDYGSVINEGAMSAMTEPDGNVYALPIRGFWEGLFVNQDLFEEYDLNLPETWDDLLVAIETFSAKGIIPIAVSFSDVPHYWIEHLILGVGGIEDHKYVLTPDEAPPASWVEGLSLFKTLYDLNAFPIDVASTNNDAVGELFKNKRAAMMLDGSWFSGGIEDQENTTVMAFPTPPNGKKDPTDIIAGFSSGFYITTKAWEDPAKRDAAVQLVMKMTSQEAIAAFAKVGGAPAANIEPPTDLSPLATAGLVFSGEAKNSDMPIDSRQTQEAWQSIVKNISGIADGSVDPGEVLEAAAKLNK